MGDDKNGPSIHLDGLHAGDWVVSIAPTARTDDHLDDPERRERGRQKEDDAHAAQHGGEGEVEPAQTQAAEDVDASLAAARAAQAPDEVPVPILLRDPLTGKVIGEV